MEMQLKMKFLLGYNMKNRGWGVGEWANFWLVWGPPYPSRENPVIFSSVSLTNAGTWQSVWNETK